MAQIDCSHATKRSRFDTEGAVNADDTEAPPDREVPAAPVSPHRISALLTSFEELREQGRSIMARMRASMYDLQSQRDRLRNGRDGHGATDAVAVPPASSSAATHLQRAYGMTPREVEVALLLAEGCSNFTVAQRLGISPHTARHHTQRVLGKLRVHSRAEAGARLRR
jgi:DNA-binding CsgD family transcriptional regulator